MTGKVFVGIDPGFNGGVAMLPKEGPEADAIVMPVIGTGVEKIIDIDAISHFLCRSGKGWGEMSAVIEKVGAMPMQGTSSMFRFGRGTGQLIGMVQTLGIPWAMVSPSRWQGVVLRDIAGKGKQRSVLWAQRTFPHVDLKPGLNRKPHDGMADALALAAWARLQA